ncbi:MAG: hypothetical protein E6Q40_11905 [Cupriavidus sp.]|nr:MAG: hypothetical protein E6Q40_11905 [Cupriavidus sp.]
MVISQAPMPSYPQAGRLFQSIVAMTSSSNTAPHEISAANQALCRGFMEDRKQGSWVSPEGRRVLRPLWTVLAMVVIAMLGAYMIPAKPHRSPAAELAGKLGKPGQLLVGLEGANNDAIVSQNIRPDILEQYLVGVGPSSWLSWGEHGNFIRTFADQANDLGATPMFTLFQLASEGEAGLSRLNDQDFMSQYWNNVTLLFLDLAAYDRPVLVNLEPVFWAYAQRRTTDGDPRQLPALVSINPDCKDLPDNVQGVATCLSRSARRYAPRALLGFPVAQWGGNSPEEVTRFMKLLGADQADFIVFPSAERDVPKNAEGENADFDAHFSALATYRKAMRDLPVLLSQASLELPADASAVLAADDRDSQVRYLLTHPERVVEAGGFGLVFSSNAGEMTNIGNDGGQFRVLSMQYRMSPATLM